MSSTESSATRFLNVDLDIHADAGVDDLIEHFGDSVLVLNRTQHSVSLELTREYNSLEECVSAFIDHVESLPPEAMGLWKACRSRRLNVGIQAGTEPHESYFNVPHSVVASIAKNGFELLFTVYAAKMP